MKYMSVFVAMMAASGMEYDTIVKDGKTTISADTLQGGRVNTVFDSKTENFITATFEFEDDLNEMRYASRTKSSGKDDYKNIVEMIKNAPVKNGRWVEAADGDYIGVLYCDNNSDIGVAFVCEAVSKTFLGLGAYQA